MHTKETKHILSIMTAIAILAAMLVPQMAIRNKAEAAGVQLYADLTNDTGNPQVPSTVTTQPVFADNTSTDVYLAYTATSVFAIGDTVAFTFPAGMTIANTCGTPTTDADNDTTVDGSGAVSGTQYTYTFTAASTLTAVEFCVDVTGPSANAQNYSVALSSTNDNDFGAALLYVYDDAGPTYQNRVIVTAQVTPLLSLSITNTSNAETDDCDLGVLDIVTVKNCVYRVYPGTNQTTGTATLQVRDIGTNAGLAKGAGGDVDNIDNTTNDTDVVAGTEGTGFEGANTGTSFTRQGIYNNATDDPVPTSLTTYAQATGYIDGTVGSGNYISVTHYGAADSGTQTGSYQQSVEWTLVSDP